MSSALIEPEMETFPNRYRWTTEACYRLMELGFLQGRFELLDGEIIDKMGQNPPHYFSIMQIARWANSFFGDQYVRVQGPIALHPPDGVYNEPEPDVVVLREPNEAFAHRHPGPEDLLLAVEVADSSLRSDIIVKARLFARAGISEYWVLDLTSRRLLCHRAPENGEYAAVTIHDETESISPNVRPDATLLISSMMPPIGD